MKNRHRVYMEAVGFINNPPAGINVYEIPLPEGINISRTTKDLKLLEQVYMAGQRAGNDFIKKFADQIE
jgi:predicted patatin/cPLA2 family phospholipase